MEKIPPFHLAFLVDDLEAAARFYCQICRGQRGRHAPNWVDIDLYGHQLSLHLGESLSPIQGYSDVDGYPVPIPHFGVVMTLTAWQDLVNHVEGTNWPFLLSPRERFVGQAEEQGTFFIQDPSGNVLEFKGLKAIDRLFEV